MASSATSAAIHSFVQLWGENVIGDGYSLLYRDGELFTEFDNDEEADGYLTAAIDFGHTVQVVRVDAGDLDWQQVERWWGAFSYDMLQVTLDAFIEQGFTMERHEKTS